MRLVELPVLFLDAQTTAATPRQGRLLELAWQASGGAAASRVVRGGEGEEILPRILRLTGIQAAELAAGASEAEVYAELARDLAAHRPQAAVIHFASFEARFLEDLWQRHAGAPFPLAFICTHAIARRLFPKLPSRSLRAIAGFFGAPVEQLKRAPGHVEATAHIWAKLCHELAAQDVAALADLRAWLGIKAPRATGPKQFPLDRALRLALPDAPGVYRMLGPSGQVLYVGKATSLKARVNSYFRQRRGLGSPKNEMLTQVVGIDATPCATPLEAALLETDEIKRLCPPYNVALRPRARPLGFFDRSLRAVAADDPAARYGPFGGVEALDAVKVVAIALAGGLASGVLLTALLHEEIADSALAGGLRQFAATLPAAVDEASPRSLLAHGVWLARAAPAATDEAESADEPGDDAADEAVPRALNEDDVARGLRELLVQSGRAVIRSRRLQRLANATIAVPAAEKGQGWRYLTMAGGELAERGWTHDLGRAPHASRPIRLGADGAAYDRVRVLATELLRIDGALVL